MARNNSPREQALAKFLARLETDELTLAEWARRHQLPYPAVHSVVSGHHVGRFGTARRVAKLMGLPVPAMHQQAAGAKG